MMITEVDDLLVVLAAAMWRYWIVNRPIDINIWRKPMEDNVVPFRRKRR
jgi:hypothetical protein